MATPKKKLKLWKAATVLPVVALMIVAFSFNSTAKSYIQDVMNESTLSVTLPDKVEIKMEKLDEKRPDYEFTHTKTESSNTEKVLKLKSIKPNTIASIREINNGDTGDILHKKGRHDDIFKQITNTSASEDSVFTVVENPAKPIEGMQEFYLTIGKTIKYPKQARKAGIEGKVYVQFIVKKDGTLSDIEIEKGIGYGCDEVALAGVISSSDGRWIPAQHHGKYVTQRIVLPIYFGLGRKSKNKKLK